MVERVVGEKALPDEVAAQIVAKTDGVPLFVEELTKTVLESGLLQDAGDHYELAGPLPPLAIPSTLHDSLLARLDRLAPVKEGRADRRRARPRVFPTRCSPRSPTGLSRSCYPPSTSWLPPSWCSAAAPARGDLQLQARPGPGRRLRHPAQIAPPATPRPHRPGPGESTSRKRRRTSPNCWRITSRKRPDRTRFDYWRKAGERAARSANVEAIRHLTPGLRRWKHSRRAPSGIGGNSRFRSRSARP